MVHKWPRSSWCRQPSGNGKRSHSEIPPLPTRTEHLYSERQVSLSVGEDVEKWEGTALWGMRDWAAAAENSLAALPTVKHRVPTWPSNLPPWCPPRRHGDAGPHKQPHTDVHGSVIRNGQKKARMSMNWRTENKACASVPWAMIPPWKERRPSHTPTQTNLGNIVLNKRGQVPHGLSPLMRNVQNRQILRDQM